MAEDPLVQRAKWLEKQCAFKLPQSLIVLARFLHGDGRGLLDDLNVRAAGPLALLLRAETPDRLDDPTGLNVPFLESRHARDLPELFTFLEGREDGLHWSLLWDRPGEAPRGVASFCSQDSELMRVYTGVFGALLDIVGDQLATVDELIEDEPEREKEHQARHALLVRRQTALRDWAPAHNSPLDEHRGQGLHSDTGLELILPAGHEQAKVTSEGVRRLDRPADIKRVCNEALHKCEQGNPYDALMLGRSLFYWKGAEERETAGVMLDRGYAAVGNHPLARVLAAHLEQLEDLEGAQVDDADDEEEEPE